MPRNYATGVPRRSDEASRGDARVARAIPRPRKSFAGKRTPPRRGPPAPRAAAPTLSLLAEVRHVPLLRLRSGRSAAEVDGAGEVAGQHRVVIGGVDGDRADRDRGARASRLEG